jgi:integrase/recombinase XerD
LISLNWEHVQERERGEGQLLILGKGNKKRVVVLSEGVFMELLKLKQLEAKPFDPVFTSREFKNPRLSKRTIQIVVDKSRLRAGIVKRVTPHWLRHAHASHALDRGPDKKFLP